MFLFEGNTADEVWQLAAAKLRDSDVAREQPSRAGNTREILGAAFTIKDPRQRWVASRYPSINPAFALAEVVWIVSGRRDAAFLNHWNPKLPSFAGTGKFYHGAYGYRLREHHGVDQLTRAYQALKHNPETRQVVLQIWDSKVDLPQESGQPSDPDIPCNICSFAKIRDGRLEWTQIMRSNDLFLGTPHNFVQFTSLQEVLAAWLGVEVGHYRHIADCLHVYVRDQDNVCGKNGHAAPNPDRLSFSKEESDEFFAEMVRRMEKMMSALMTEGRLEKLGRSKDFPETLRNWLLVIAADSARRRRWTDLAMELMADCSNPVLQQLWEGWFDRWWNARREETISADAALHAQLFLPLHAVRA